MRLIDMLPRPGGDDDRVAVVDGAAGRSWTRAQVREAVAAQATALLERGVEPGQRVLVLLDHDARGLFFLAAASALGLRLLMPYNLAAAAAAEWRTIAATARPDAVVHLRRDGVGRAELDGVAGRSVVLPAELPGGRPLEEVTSPASCAADFLVLFTSGTTGAPKAISVPEEVICARVRSVTNALEFDANARVFMSGLLNNTTGVIFSFGAFLHGATLVLPRGRDIATWPAQVAAAKATHIMLRPVALRRFVESAQADPVDLTALRVVAYGAAAMPRAALEAGRALMPCHWAQGYGLSETYGPFCWLDEQAHAEQRYRSGAYNVGRPDEGVEVSIEPLPGHPDGIGEVLVRGTGLMAGYLDVASGALTPPGEWLRTGDLGCRTADGDLLLKGRIVGSLMSADGHRIYPEEVEAVLAEVPGVDDVVLVGAGAGGVLDEQPVACLSGALGTRPPEVVRAVVSAALAGSLSREKWPDLVSVTSVPFPRSANDKVKRAEVIRSIDRSALIPL